MPFRVLPCATPANAVKPNSLRKSGKARCLLGVAVLVLSQAAVAGDPCGAVLCLSISKAAPQQCKGHVDDYFKIRVYRSHHRFDPAATAARRYSTVLAKCSNARPEDREFVHATYGMLYDYPFGFSSDGNGE